jgi:hypothetical protein
MRLELTNSIGTRRSNVTERDIPLSEDNRIDHICMLRLGAIHGAINGELMFDSFTSYWLWNGLAFYRSHVPMEEDGPPWRNSRGVVREEGVSATRCDMS